MPEALYVYRKMLNKEIFDPGGVAHCALHYNFYKHTNPLGLKILELNTKIPARFTPTGISISGKIIQD